MKLPPRIIMLKEIFTKIDFQPNGCWYWRKGFSKNGYGMFSYNSKLFTIHKLMYRLLIGEVPAGLVLDHYKCNTKKCCNPLHLEPVTHVENMRRAQLLVVKKDFCADNHRLFVDNIGRRYCKICISGKNKLRYAQKKDLPPNPIAHRKSVCKHGHPYDDKNTLTISKTGARQCRACNRNRLTKLRRNGYFKKSL